MYPPPGGARAKTLAEMVYDKLDAGTLPLDAPVKLWAGQGSGQPCMICEQPILASEPEYETEYDDDDGRRAMRFHAGCHAVWEEERKRRTERNAR
jgi:hypothetical protein